MTSASLTIVGTGLKFGTQLTPQANEVIRRCDRLFYLVYDPVSARWLDELKPSAVRCQVHSPESGGVAAAVAAEQ